MIRVTPETKRIAELLKGEWDVGLQGYYTAYEWECTIEDYDFWAEVYKKLAGESP